TNVAQAVEALRMQTQVDVANRLPIVGEWLARRLERDERGLAIAPALPLLDTSRWAWGGESLLVAEFEVPPAMTGKPHSLRIGVQVGLTVGKGEGVRGLEGASTPRAVDDDRGYSLRIAELVARAGTEFELTRHSLKARVEQVREKLAVNETKRQSGIMRIE